MAEIATAVTFSKHLNDLPPREQVVKRLIETAAERRLLRSLLLLIDRAHHERVSIAEDAARGFVPSDGTVSVQSCK